jgi:hypothetical protein
LPLACDPRLARSGERLVRRAVWESSAFRRATLAVLDLLERGKLRLAWVRLFNIAHGLSYERGVQAADTTLVRDLQEPLLDVDLDGDAPIAAPTRVAPTLRICVGGEEVARVRPHNGQWTAALAEQILQAAPWSAVERAATLTGCLPHRAEAHRHLTATEVVFGPGHTARDAHHAAQLRADGVAVSVIEGSPAEHWPAVKMALHQSGPDLVALTVPGVQPDPRWLQQALVAFDGERVGVVLGRALRGDVSPAPLLLHARGGHGDGRPSDATIAPHYVVFRRELLPALAIDHPDLGLLAPILALVEDALEGGWVVGYRDVHGLSGEGVRRFEGARALTAVRIGSSMAPAVTAWAELRRTTMLTLRHLIRRENRRTAVETYAGALVGLAHGIGLPGA